MNEINLQDIILQKIMDNLCYRVETDINFTDDYKIEIITHLTSPVKFVHQVSISTYIACVEHLKNHGFDEWIKGRIRLLAMNALTKYKHHIIDLFLK